MSNVAALQIEEHQPSVESLLRRLHIVVLGAQADAAEATHVVRSERAKRDLETALKEAHNIILQMKGALGSVPR